MKNRAIAVLLTSSALLVAGCGGDDEEEATPAASTPAATSTPAEAAPAPADGDTVEIGMLGLQFDPKDVTVQVGQTVKWVNNEDIPHNAVATKGAEFESETFGKDGTYEWTAEKAGKIDYVCTLHPNMVGTLTVEG